jgi:hypothetical protein
MYFNGKGQGNVADQRGGHAGLARRLGLLLQPGELVRMLRVEIGGDALKVAVDRVLLDPRGDPLQCGAGRIHDCPEVLDSPLGAQILEPQIRYLGDVGRGSSRGAAADPALVDQCDPLALFHQQARRRHAGDAGPNDRDVHPRISFQRRILRRLGPRVPPERLVAIVLHAAPFRRTVEQGECQERWTALSRWRAWRNRGPNTVFSFRRLCLWSYESSQPRQGRKDRCEDDESEDVRKEGGCRDAARRGDRGRRPFRRAGTV